MADDEELSDARKNREARNIIERIMGANIFASFSSCLLLLYLFNIYDIISEYFVNLFGFYPECILIKELPSNIRIAVMTSNICTLSYVVMHLMWMRPEVIRDRYKRQDRRQILFVLSGIFYIFRLCLLFLFRNEKGVPFVLITFPAWTIASISMMIIGLTTVPGDIHEPKP